MLNKSKARRTENRRHRALMSVADHVVSRHVIAGDSEQATTGEIIALAFGRHQLRITHAEALDFLNAQLAARSLPLRGRVADTVSPEDDQ
ncbi:hypothetical protein [Streptomyces sp. GbtcB6]|uniref:hypothetical protein n=1 Tax=Streptomyces sp. GbtcB6 TaxID=2824751 RepID=UPI001C2F2D2C|nr:hypothetical protein [Streptomyces sp. GbtcB6]